jgi:hypothetical protein
MIKDAIANFMPRLPLATILDGVASAKGGGMIHHERYLTGPVLLPLN